MQLLNGINQANIFAKSELHTQKTQSHRFIDGCRRSNSRLQHGNFKHGKFAAKPKKVLSLKKLAIFSLLSRWLSRIWVFGHWFQQTIAFKLPAHSRSAMIRHYVYRYNRLELISDEFYWKLLYVVRPSLFIHLATDSMFIRITVIAFRLEFDHWKIDNVNIGWNDVSIINSWHSFFVRHLVLASFSLSSAVETEFSSYLLFNLQCARSRGTVHDFAQHCCGVCQLSIHCEFNTPSWVRDAILQVKLSE